MLVALDLTGDVIAYSYHDGSSIVTEYLRYIVGFRTKDLFQDEAGLTAVLRVAKDMIECTGVVITETIFAVPVYCNYAGRERVKKAAQACGMKVRTMIKGSLASALGLYQTAALDGKTVFLCNVHSNYAEYLLFHVDGEVLRVHGSTTIAFTKEAAVEDANNLLKKTLDELKALYAELGMTVGEKDEELYIMADENAGPAGALFPRIMEASFAKTPTSIENEISKGALSLLMKLADFRCDQIRKCFLVDCCVEGISIGSGVGGDLQEVFKRNTELPVQNTVNLSISYDNVLCFYAGNYRNRDYDEPIGTCRIPEQYRSQTVHVKITLNEEGIVEYVVLDKNRQVIYPRRVLS